MAADLSAKIQTLLQHGTVIPAMPLALSAERRFDERRQRALCRYYMAAGAGGLAVGVHSTQFEIREPQHALLRPVLALAIEELRRAEQQFRRPIVKVSGICGATRQAVAEAEQARELGYDLALVSLAALKSAATDELVDHCRNVAEILPIMGFYLQPAAGGRILPLDFWRRFAGIERVAAVKIAPFNRYQTIDVVRAVAESGRALDPAHPRADAIALYTGNDDNIVGDLLGEWTFQVAGRPVTQRIVGGLLGHWACWTHAAVELLQRCRKANTGETVPAALLDVNRQVTDMNAALFDSANGFSGCIAGIHEILRRQGLLAGTWCLNPKEQLSPGQAEELTRVTRDYPHLTDDAFVAQHRDAWLA